MHETLKKAVAFLCENELVEVIEEGLTQSGGDLKATILGKAIVTSALSIDEGLFVHRELQRSMRAFILDDELVPPLPQIPPNHSLQNPKTILKTILTPST